MELQKKSLLLQLNDKDANKSKFKTTKCCLRKSRLWFAFRLTKSKQT